MQELTVKVLPKHFAIEISMPSSMTRDQAEGIMDRLRDSCAIDPRKGITATLKE